MALIYMGGGPRNLSLLHFEFSFTSFLFEFEKLVDHISRHGSLPASVARATT